MIALTRTCNLADFPECHTPADWQARLVAEAYQRWWPSPEADLHAAHLLLNLSGLPIQTIPEVAPALCELSTPEDFIRYTALKAAASIVTLMVLDHVEAPGMILRHSAGDLMPGGLFVTTAAYWDAEGDDVTRDRASRVRLYNRISWRKLIVQGAQYGLVPYGGIDWTYHGHVLGDHTLASLVLTKGNPR